MSEGVKELKYAYNVSSILRGRANSGSIPHERFLEITFWLAERFGDEYRLHFLDQGAIRYWELQLAAPESWVIFRLVWGAG
jgi:hypothetical protein